jgi:5-aminopentanamidase
VRVAAWQAPLAPEEDVVVALRRQVRRCEDEGVDVLCCPETILGGLADGLGPSEAQRRALGAG